MARPPASLPSGPQALGGIGLDPADRFLQRQALTRDVAFRQRRIDAAQLGEKRRARAIVQNAAVLGGVLVEAATAREINGK